MAGTRIELVTSGLGIRRSNQLSYPAVCECKVTTFFLILKIFYKLFKQFLLEKHPGDFITVILSAAVQADDLLRYYHQTNHRGGG